MGADFDAVVIGAGFGGMGAALRLAEAGARVCLLETLNYPGGCASTFSRAGYRFEAGATLFSGFAEGQLFRRIVDDYGLDVQVHTPDPMVRLRTPDFELDVGADRDALFDRLVKLGTPAEPLRKLQAKQRAVADALWALFDDPALLPPFSPARLLTHAARMPRYAPILPLIGRPLGRVLDDLGLGDAAALRAYLDAVCQITVQCSAAEAEAPFALSTVDYYHRGTGHVRGGIGALADAMIGLLRRLGVEVRFGARARGLHRRDGRWTVEGRKGEVRAPVVLANLVPQSLRALLGGEPGDYPVLDRAANRVEQGWGAAMLYLAVEPPRGASPDALHLELVQDPAAPFVEGNHIFCSISGEADEGRAPAGQRTVTVSTHVPLADIRRRPPEEQARDYEEVQRKMRVGLERLAPKWARGIRFQMTASPRTFERFTGRFAGFVGGVPRRAGLGNYRGMVPSPPAPGLFMIGDSVFPGQSTLATAVGGIKAADRALSLVPSARPSRELDTERAHA